jgi:hypothetical protein
MCIYCGTKYYRKIYENHVGSIPKDETGRSYDIHHKDGDHSNSHYTNLVALTIKDHYDAHYANNDWAACLIMSARMSLSAKAKSELAKQSVARQLTNDKHAWKGGNHQRNLALKRSLDGSHPFLGGEIQREHNLRRIADGSHPFTKKQTCEHCGKQANLGMYARWHGDNCKHKHQS